MCFSITRITAMQNNRAIHSNVLVIVLYLSISIALLTARAFQKCSRLKTTAIDTVSEFTRRALQATGSEGLAQGPYVATKAGFEPATLRSKDIASTKAPPRS